MMKSHLLAGAVALVAAATLSPSIARASLVLDSGTPAGTNGNDTLFASQWLAEEFAHTDTSAAITSVSLYLNQGSGSIGDTYTIDLYAAGGFTNASSSRPAPVATTTGTFSGNGWNTTSVDWTGLASGNYWVAFQVSGSTQTRGLSALVESSWTAGTVEPMGFAIAGTTHQYKTYAVGGSTDPVGMQVGESAPVPLPASGWLLGCAAAGLGTLSRRRPQARG
jgi:hypothetical protein